MPYLFKLARRLACIHKLAMVSVAVATAACRQVSSPDNPPVELFVSPDSVSLTAGQSLQFVSFGRTQLGDSVPVAVIWTASSGLITADGWFSADTVPGDYEVTATSSAPRLKRAAKVRINRVPRAVSDLSAIAANDHSATLSFTEVNDGAGQPANYEVRYGVAPIDWETARAVSEGTCTTPVVGTAIGASRTCTVQGLAAATQYAFQMVALREREGAAPVLGPLSNVATSTTLDSEGPSPVASVTVLPASVNLFQGTGHQLAAVAKDSTGTVLTGRAIAWSSNAPAMVSVDSTGFVGGLAVGTATITATSEGQSAASAVTVVPVPVASVAVSPASASVLVAATQQLSAVVRDSAGNVLSGRTVTWTSSAPLLASVSASGLVTGLLPGALTITAASEGKSGTATITVAGSGAPEPGPGDSILFADGFESGSLSLWQQIPANGRYSITTTAARVKSGARAMQVLYTPTNGYGMITRWFMPGVDEVYVTFHVLFEEGFQNMRGDGNGMHFFALSGNRIDDDRSSFGKSSVKPNGSDYFYAGLDPEYVQWDPLLRPFAYYTYWPDMACGSACYGNVFTQPLPKTALVGGQWQEVVFHVKLNTPGQSNGSQTVWIDGVKKLEKLNMRWRTTTDLRLNEIRFDNYMPGGLKTQYLWLDDVTVWTP